MEKGLILVQSENLKMIFNIIMTNIVLDFNEVKSVSRKAFYITHAINDHPSD